MMLSERHCTNLQVPGSDVVQRQQFSGLQKGIGCRLSSLVITAPSNGVEACGELVRSQVTLDRLSGRRCGNRTGKPELIQGVEQFDHTGFQR